MFWLDVFLTTMKPQQKVVTAQDIESSLYYVHVDSEEDMEFLKSEEPNDEADERGVGSITAQVGQNVIHRKPVLPPRRPTQELGYRPQAHPHLQFPSRTAEMSATPGRKPVEQGSGKPNSKSTEMGSMFVHRKVLGPRPLCGHPQPVGSTILGDVTERQNIDTRRWPEQAVSLQPRVPLMTGERKIKKSDEKDREYSARSNRRLYSMEDGRSCRSNESYNTLSGKRLASESSLTLIRRYDYIQSNVGKILASDLPGGSLELDILGAGYFKFNADINESMRTASFEEQEQAVYRCQLHNITSPSRPNHSRRTESHDSPVAHRLGLRDSLDSRRRSHASFDGVEPVSRPKPAFTKGYTFQSPWNGTCNFVTGVAGRSLRCLHSHPSRYGQAIEVSELRFNLPSSKAFAAAPKSLTPGTPRDRKRSSYFSKSHRRQEALKSIDNASTGSEIDLDDRLDLSLGQEHAGGGFGGKHAKLGKLIIEKDGLQMLDLVVAANMALWWRVYDQMV